MLDASDDGTITRPDDRGASRRLLLGGLVGGIFASVVGWQETTAARKRRARRNRARRHRRKGRGGDPTRARGKGNQERNAAALKVLTHNLYLGADLTPTLDAQDFPSLVTAASQVYAVVQATNFPERAKALADEIAAIDPHLVGLQEVTLWRSETPSNLSLIPNAITVEYDFLALLLDELASRGKAYAAVATVQNFDAEAPRATSSTTLQDVRITDHDVILARTDLPPHVFSVENAASDNYDARVLVPLLGAQIPILRGWTSVDVRLHGQAIQVISTHLEPVNQAIQQQQAAELLAVIDQRNTGTPTVLLGDLNSAAPGGASYRAMLSAGFVDAWTTAKRNDAGLTCCQAEDVHNADPTLTERVDFVLTRGGIAASSANRVGDEPEDRTPSGLWPSDHAGVWAVLHLQ
jgi:hypothetical protein